MERKTIPPMDAKIFEDMGIKMAKKEDGTLSISYSYARKVKKLEKREHLALVRYPGEKEATVLGHYWVLKYVTGWNDSRGKYHWPYSVYIATLFLVAGGVYVIGRALPDAATMAVFGAVTGVAVGIGWFLEWWSSLYSRVTIHETKMEGIKDAVAYDPDEMDITKRYGEVTGDFTELNTYSLPLDFFSEFVLVIGCIQIYDKHRRLHLVINNHVGNIGIGPGVTGTKFSNLLLLRGLPSVTIVPKDREVALGSLNAYAETHKLEPNRIQEATELVKNAYDFLDKAIAKQDELEAIVGKDVLQIDFKDDFVYAYMGSAEMMSKENVKRYRDFIESGGSLNHEAIEAINKAKIFAQTELDLPVLLRQSEEKGMRRNLGDMMGQKIADNIIDSHLAQNRSFAEHANAGREAAKKREEIPTEDIVAEFLTKNSDE